ncbi:hypothetical protein SESBI_36750 [Sesbania bispinosa]|nr:hypothetical protein SESBI_36750 [Sesbania bispinosa]
MTGVYDPVSSVFPGRQNWRLKVRVVRVWDMFPIDEPSRTFSVEMVLVDQMGTRIQASIRKPMMRRFSGSVIEGEAYKMHYFGVVRNLGSYRSTKHEFKLVFHPRTRIMRCDVGNISLHGLSPMNTQEIMSTNGRSDYLVDTIGVMTAVSAEKRSFRDGRMTRVMQMELTDDKGKIQCAMFGNYDMVGDLLHGIGNELPVVVVMFAKVKMYKGEVVLQNVLNTTKILCNPNIPEVETFRDGLTIHDIDILAPMGVIQEDHQSIPLKEEFLASHPRKTIKQLHNTEEDGLFIVLASIVTVIGNANWWYAACKCHRAVTMDGDSYYCSACGMHVQEVSSRFKLKLEVYDGEDTAAFVLFDSDSEMLLGRSCAAMLSDLKDNPPDDVSYLFDDIAGKEVLFKVEKPSDYAFKFDDSFRVKKICCDTSVINEFKDENAVVTPDARVLRVPFPNLDDIPQDDGGRGAIPGEESKDTCVELNPVSLDEVVSPSAKCYGTNESGTSNAAKERVKGKKKLKLKEAVV